MKTVYQKKSEVLELLENWLTDEMDWGDSAMNNYESFLEYTASLGYEMPVDSNDYFDFRNEIYSEISRQLHDFQAQCPDDNAPFYLD